MVGARIPNIEHKDNEGVGHKGRDTWRSNQTSGGSSRGLRGTFAPVRNKGTCQEEELGRDGVKDTSITKIAIGRSLDEEEEEEKGEGMSRVAAS